jgi:hypothetical protein
MMIFFFFCLTYVFFKKRLSVVSVELEKFSYMFFKIFENFFFLKLRRVHSSLPLLRVTCIYWLFFIYLLSLFNNLKLKKNFFLCAKFWNFFIYCVFLNKIIFGLKSAKVVSIFWPKYLLSPMDLFYRMTEKSLKSDNFKSGTEFCNSNKNFKKYDFFNNFFF